MSDKREKMLEKVRGLINKAESTEHEAERVALLAKAEQLMVAYAIEQADLEAGSEEADKIVTRRFRIAETKGYKSAREFLLSGVTKYLDVQVVIHHGYKATDTTVVGYEADVAYAEMLYTSLLTQMSGEADRAWKLERGDRWDPTAGDARVFKTSFMNAFSLRIAARMHQARQAAIAQAEANRQAKVAEAFARDGEAAFVNAPSSRGAELVLADRKAEVVTEYERLFPNLGKPRVSKRTRSDHYGAVAGDRAGQRANIAGRGAPVGQRKQLG